MGGFDGDGGGGIAVFEGVVHEIDQDLVESAAVGEDIQLIVDRDCKGDFALGSFFIEFVDDGFDCGPD